MLAFVAECLPKENRLYINHITSLTSRKSTWRAFSIFKDNNSTWIHTGVVVNTNYNITTTQTASILNVLLSM